jgi:hypothetical protein
MSFLDQLDQAANERHQRIVLAGPTPTASRMPSGYRAEDVMEGRADGFLPLSQAAKQMGMPEIELLDLVAQGVLESRDGSLYLHVRPAIVSKIAVRTTSVHAS